MPGSVGGGHSGSFGGGPSFSGGGFSAGGTPHHVNTQNINTQHANERNNDAANRVFPAFVGGAAAGQAAGRSGGSEKGAPSFLRSLVFICAAVSFITALSSIVLKRQPDRSAPVFFENAEEELYIDTGKPLYEKLPGEMCAPLPENALLDCSVEGLFRTEEGRQDVCSAMTYFYEKTGVQPYLIIADENAGVEEELYDRYVSLFGEDEGHMIFLYETNGNDYTGWYICGLNAEEYFGTELADNVIETVDALARQYDGTDLSKLFSSAFTESADEYMGRTECLYIGKSELSEEQGRYFYYYEKDDGTVGRAEYIPEDPDFSLEENVVTEIPVPQPYPAEDGSSAIASPVKLLVPAVLMFIVVFMAYKRRKGDGETEKKRERKLFRSSGKEDKIELNTEKYSMKSRDRGTYNASDYPVTCPGCRATAYLTNDGCCQYCGKKLK